MRLHIRYVLIAITSLLLIGCGGGGGSISTGISPKDFSIAKIAAYATGGSVKPNVQDYENAGILGVDEDNIDKVNDYVKQTGTRNIEDWTMDSDGDGVIDAIDGAPHDPNVTNNTPVANNGSIVATYETAKHIILGASDIDGDALTYSITSNPSHGTLSGTAPNLTYTPNNGYKGTDSFTFKVFDGTINSNTATISIEVTEDPNTILITEDYQVVDLGKGGSIQKTIKLGTTAKSLYILLSNYDKSHTSNPTISHSAKIAPVVQDKLSALHMVETRTPKAFHTPNYITRFNRSSGKLLRQGSGKRNRVFRRNIKRSKDVAGNSKVFYLESGTTSSQTTATAKKIVSNISTSFGNKTLNVWVSDDSFGAGCSKEKCVTQSMVDELAATFLKPGADNDIYDWVTNIYGEEWGSDAHTKYTNLITENDEITILLTDIENDNKANGGVIGYFYAKDNYTDINGSNKRVMFYIDSVMLANTDFGDEWQKEIYSTLAHEFVHMIDFYQKTVLKDTVHDVWIAEMIAETTEDLVATKIEHKGPRNVEYTDGSAGSTDNSEGRYPRFNENNTLSLTKWNNTLADYSKVSAFGTFLTRNYGGAKVLHDIMHNTKKHENAIEYATGKSFDTLLKKWGIGVMLSDHDSLEDMPTYNTGDFTEDHYGNSTYELGSINFFNYDPKPLIKTTIGAVKAQGNYYYKIGKNLTGNITIDLTLASNTEATLIAK